MLFHKIKSQLKTLLRFLRNTPHTNTHIYSNTHSQVRRKCILWFQSSSPPVSHTMYNLHNLITFSWTHNTKQSTRQPRVSGSRKSSSALPGVFFLNFCHLVFFCVFQQGNKIEIKTLKSKSKHDIKYLLTITTY